MADPAGGSIELEFGAADRADIADIVTLVQVAYRGDASRAGWTTEADLIEGQRVDADMVRQAIDRPDGRVLTARIDGELVACCELQDRPEQCQAYLGMFAVRPDLQAGGVGRRVLGEGERIAVQEWGAREMVMTVLDARVELIAWYERRGYSRTGEVGDFPYEDERFGRPTRPGLRFAHLAKPLGRSGQAGSGGQAGSEAAHGERS